MIVDLILFILYYSFSVFHQFIFNIMDNGVHQNELFYFVFCYFILILLLLVIFLIKFNHRLCLIIFNVMHPKIKILKFEICDEHIQ